MLFAVAGVAILVAAGAYWLLVIRPRTSAPRASARETKASTPFGGVEISVRIDGCDAARELEGQRFLAKEAPALPLPNCTATRCTCKFVKLRDRRTDGRRLESDNLTASMFIAANRRKKRDRRRSAQKKKV